MAKVTKVEPRITKDDLLANAKEYAFIKKQIDYLEKQQKEIRQKLFAQLDEAGESDDKGNVILELPEEVEGYSSVTKQRRVTRKINEEIAYEIIDQKGLRDKLVKTIEVIDQDALLASLYTDELTEDEIDRMYPQNVVWALVMNKR